MPYGRAPTTNWMLPPLLFAMQLTTAAAAEPPTVHEITMAAPDIVRIEIREAPVRQGRIVKLPSPSISAHGSWIGLGGVERGVVIGPKRDHVRVADTADIARLDRSAVHQSSHYGPLGNRRVVAVYRKSVPWSAGRVASSSGPTPVASFRHFVYLKLDGVLAPGSYTVRWPGGLLPPTKFTFDDKITRSSSIRANQVGHSIDDVSKYAYLVLWLPGGPDNGAVDFRRYGLHEFHIVNEQGDKLFTGPIVLRLGPQDVEASHRGHGDLKTYTRADRTTYQANRAGTYVFGLDYTALRDAPPGIYRIAIPTLGTSDPFAIDDAVWYRAARASMAGLYHQRSGLALDGRFGYFRPECFTEASGVTVRQSKLPFAFSKESGIGFVNFTEAAKPPWITDEVVADAWGGYHDAADWDRIIVHASASYLLLDVYENLPNHARDIKFGTPASGEVLRDPVYRGKDFPDLVDEAVWGLDFFRRVQRPDGAVRPSIDSAGSPKLFEPCWLESQSVFAYAPDPGSNFEYAAAAAKLAIVLKGLGEGELSVMYRDSAIRAWDWGERALAEPETVFGEPRRLLGLSDTDYEKRMNLVLQQARDHKARAAGTLFRLTGQDRFNRAALERLKVWYPATVLDGAWEYSNAHHPEVDTKVQQSVRRLIVETARKYITAPQAGQVAYRTMQWGGLGLMWGSGLAPNKTEASLLIRAHRISGDRGFLATMLDGSGHILGANQIGMSFTTGLGHRWPLAPLHADSIAAGVPPPMGITIYGWTTPGMTGMYWWVWSPASAALSDEVPEKRVEPAPARTVLPYYEFLIEYPWIIISSEYTIHQTIATTAAVWIYLHVYRGGAVGR
jgi:Glycosyl hydrolase family 9